MKKLLSLLLSLCMISALAFSANAIVVGESVATQEESSLSVMSKDMVTGEITYSTYTPEMHVNAGTFGMNVQSGWCPDNLERATLDEETGIEIARVIGSVDDRVRVPDTEVYPYSAICYLEASFTVNGEEYIGYGTAFMIGDNVAVTAAHCLFWEGTQQEADEVKIWPGKDGYGLWNNPFGTATTIHVLADNWRNGPYQENDWAVIILDENIGNDTGWLGFTWQYADIVGNNLTMSGYPYANQYYQYTATDMIVELQDYYLIHRIDATDGQSGAPLYDSQNIVYAIHTTSYDNSRNRANRITLPIYNYLMSCINSY